MNTPNPVRDADLIILGGGCAGLSLATNLVLAKPSSRVLIVEPRTAYLEDRTWCGWRLAPHLFQDCTVMEWPQWRVINDSKTVECGALYPYEMVRSDLFYAKASEVIRNSRACSILHGVSADKCTSSATTVRVALSDGSTAEAPWVIDTRPQKQTLRAPWLWQHFLGFVVEFDSALKNSLGQVPTLMDFQPRDHCVAQFMYVLPISEREVLYEWTQFSDKPCHMQELETNLSNWLGSNAPPGWSVKRRESGSLPMAVCTSSQQGRVINAGTRGGSMRASSGYAFHSIQRWAEKCAAAIEKTGVPIAPERNRLLEYMDTLFMQVLQQRSCSAADVFGALFQHCPPDALVRFLSGLPRTEDLWPVMRVLPWTRFLLAGPEAAYNWSRQ